MVDGNQIRTSPEFEDWLYERFSRSTVIETMRKIRYLEAKGPLNSRESIMEYLRKQRREGATKKRINEYIKILNRLLEYKGEEKVLYLKVQRESFKVRYYDSEQINTLVTKTKGGSLEDKRDHAMLLLALNTGLRRAEICDLRVIDIHEHTVTVIRGKGEKTRDVYLDIHTRSVLMDYIRIRNNQELPYVFTTRKGKVNEHYMGTIARRIRQKTGIEFSWHKCRHTYAKNLIRNDVDLETIRKMLGHADLGTTQIYSVLDSGEAIERVMNRNVKFYKEGNRFKSSKPRTFVDGPAGI